MQECHLKHKRVDFTFILWTFFVRLLIWTRAGLAFFGCYMPDLLWVFQFTHGAWASQVTTRDQMTVSRVYQMSRRSFTEAWDAATFTAMKEFSHMLPRQPLNVVWVIRFQMCPQCILCAFTTVLKAVHLWSNYSVWMLMQVLIPNARV